MLDAFRMSCGSTIKSFSRDDVPSLDFVVVLVILVPPACGKAVFRLGLCMARRYMGCPKVGRDRVPSRSLHDEDYNCPYVWKQARGVSTAV